VTTDAPPRPLRPPPRASRARAVFAIVGVGLLRVARDRLGLFFIMVLPFIVILLFGAGDAQDGSLPVGVVAGDGPEAALLVDALETEGSLAVRHFEDAEPLVRAVRRDELVGGLVATGLDRGAGDTSDITWVGSPGSASAPAARVAVNAAIAELDTRLVAVRVLVEEVGLHPSAAAEAAAEIADDPLIEVVEEHGGGQAFAFGVDEAAQHNLVLFVFITSLTGGGALIEARRLGTTRRMLASPTSAATVLAGEAAARFAIAGTQALIVLAGASLFFGATWGDPVAVAAVVGLFCLVGTGAAMLFGATLSHVEQASAVAAPLGIGLGMLGGALWPLEIAPPVMQTIGRAVPHAWAIDALREVGSRGGGLGDVVVELAVLAVFATALLAVATWRLRVTMLRG
jgi:ABC-2 type transport system permease protein